MHASKKTSVEVIEEQLSDVIGDAVGLLNLTRRDETDESRFHWLYNANPDGVAKVWSVRDPISGQMIGFTAVLPRRVQVAGQIKIAWNGADFSIHPNYRTLGPAIKLRRAARKGIDENHADFLYAHPNDRMAAIHKRVGHVEIGSMVRYARIVKSAAHIQQRIDSNILGRAAGRIADGMLALVRRETWHQPSHELKVISPVYFDQRFDRLFEDSAGMLDVVGIRDARYLNWRYADNPLYETHAITAKKGKCLCGYLLYSIQDDVMHIKDIFPPTDAIAAGDLVSHALGLARRHNIKSVSFTLLDGPWLSPTLKQFGFRKRAGSSQMFGYARVDDPNRDTILSSNSWFLTVGDRDV